jgi:hypothetical protein
MFLAVLSAAALFVGTLSAAPAGAQTASVSVANPGHQWATWSFDVHVQLTASGGVAPYHWTITLLPPALSINPSTGLISGTDWAGQAENYPVTVTATDSVGSSGSTSFTWTLQRGCRTC